jgi:hypothetical protein
VGLETRATAGLEIDATSTLAVRCGARGSLFIALVRLVLGMAFGVAKKT